MRDAPGTLHEACQAQGLPVVSVRWHSAPERYEVVLDGATQAQTDQAAAMAADMLARTETADESLDRRCSALGLRRLLRALLAKGTLTEQDLGL